jgi:hypothetical protein
MPDRDEDDDAATEDDTPGLHVDDDDSDEVPEPNEPA